MGRKDPRNGGVYADCWHIPGGGVEDGEEKQTALVREILEETHLDANSAEIKLIDDLGRGATEKTLKTTGERVWCNMRFNVFEVNLKQYADEITLAPTEELPELRWFDISELVEVQLTPPSLELFKRLGYLI